jgi:hypothetical protein
MTESLRTGQNWVGTQGGREIHCVIGHPAAEVEWSPSGHGPVGRQSLCSTTTFARWVRKTGAVLANTNPSEVNGSADRDATAEATLTADFLRTLPGGTLDDATFEQIESALDKADATCQDAAEKWLLLPERIRAMGAEIGRLRSIVTVNLLRHVPGTSHEAIKRLLDGGDPVLTVDEALVPPVPMVVACWRHKKRGTVSLASRAQGFPSSPR